MTLPFDEVYLLNMVERQDKYIRMRDRIDYMGWDVIDFRVVSHPISNTIVECMGNDLLGHGYAMNYGGVFNCTREQYTIIKSAYLRGLESVAIIEDDASFLKYKDVWTEYINTIPQDYDVLRFNSLRGPNEEKYCSQSESNWVPLMSLVWGTGFYALSRHGMEYMIRYIDSKYCPIDVPIAMPTNHVNIYIPKIELSLCLEDSFSSDIRGDISDTDFANAYKRISTFDKNNYI
jgi:GR25 family glycosyltransferase involved in LPS biosynthesis